MNQITITGNVTKDPEMIYTANSKAIAKFSVATSYGKDDKKQTTYHDVKVFGEMAENVAKSIAKGCRVTVVGRLEKSTYDRKDGQKGYAVDIIAESVALDLRFRAAMVDETEQTMNKIKQAFPSSQLMDEEPF